MNEPFDSMIERFRQRIDFDGAIRQEHPGQLVLVIWPDMLSAPGISGGGWSIVGDTTQPARGGAEREWVMRRGVEMVSVDAFVATDGVEAARQFFLEDASKTMMPEIPYVRGPGNVGTICVSSLHPTSASIRWVYRNVHTKVEKTDSAIDVVPITKWLQTLYQSGLVPDGSPRLHLLPSLEVSSHAAAVGETITVTLKDAADSRYIMGFEYDRRAIDKSSFPGPLARLKGVAPGRTVVNIQLINVATLASSIARVNLDIVDGPKGK